MDTKYFICHRLPERSFFWRGHQFPVCARCTGVYLSIVTVPLLRMLRLDFQALLILGIILIAPMAVDGTTQLFRLRESNNYLRLFTGFIGGIGVLCFSALTKTIIMGVL
ncbi:MAG: DUF2085 domain-containing protein [Methanobrevibacter sp.]|uniref:DUF2085 domain-containing protein n=1 Tax=Methanobrevibacter sp. TaxID=66852 RepID=UPI0026E09C42|nr:DUF2085 domain-containing protein [Methanobrevibacter sp.]MDO5849457.1 DUF2085 domain-containing protein [Methanobrevibacter sp.]